MLHPSKSTVLWQFHLHFPSPKFCHGSLQTLKSSQPWCLLFGLLCPQEVSNSYSWRAVMPTGAEGGVGKKPICCSPLMDMPGKFTRAEDLRKNLIKWWLRWTKIKLDLFKPWTKSSQLPQSPPCQRPANPYQQTGFTGLQIFLPPKRQGPPSPHESCLWKRIFLWTLTAFIHQGWLYHIY